MKPIVIMLLVFLDGGLSPRRGHSERCQIVEAIMDGRTLEGRKAGRKPFKDQDCIKGTIHQGRYWIKAYESREKEARQALLSPGEVCPAGYEGIGDLGKPGVLEKPGTYTYLEFEVHAGSRPNELIYSGGQNIKMLERDGTVDTIGKGCGGYTKGRIRHIEGKWLPVDDNE